MNYSLRHVTFPSWGESCDLGFLWSHPSPPPPPHHRFFCTQLEELFDKALRDTHQLRYIIAFPMVCTEFLRSTSPFAPEEVGVASSGALSHEMTQPNLMHAQLCVLSNLMFTAPSLLPFLPPLLSSPSLLPLPSLACKHRRDVRQYCQLLLGAHSQGDQVSDGNAV